MCFTATRRFGEQIRDAAGIIQIQSTKLDLEYVERWVAALDIEEQWLAARETAR
jgi:hypothetical protein